MHHRRVFFVQVALVVIAGCASVTAPDLSQMSFSDAPLVGKVIWYDLIADDLDASQRFYGELFGWTFEDGGRRNGADYVLARLDGVYVAGMVATADPAGGGEYSRWLPYISVTDVDASAGRARVAGADVVAGPLDVRLGRVAVIVDPEGAAIGLARSDIGDPDDSTTAGAPGRMVWTELLAGDAAAAASFYEAVIGYTARTAERRGGEYTMLTADGTDRAGLLRNPTDWSPQWLTSFGVEDPAAAADRAAELGGEILLAPTLEVREGGLALVTDPSGAVLALQRWPQPDTED
jgi:predicted enzyme related to lactoylglutathione lyase